MPNTAYSFFNDGRLPTVSNVSLGSKKKQLNYEMERIEKYLWSVKLVKKRLGLCQKGVL
jgi:hypothetical protein